MELIGLLRRIVKLVEEVANQIQDGARERFRQWENKELRSRQRNTYRRMIDRLDLSNILACIKAVYVVYQSVIE